MWFLLFWAAGRKQKSLHLLRIIIALGRIEQTRWEAHSCHLKRFKWQHFTLVVRLICAKSSHTGWINDIMKEGEWVAASWLLMNIGAAWLSSAASIMHHNLHQLFGSSWPAPSGWCNLTWHPAIKHHHGDGKLKTFFCHWCWKGQSSSERRLKSCLHLCLKLSLSLLLLISLLVSSQTDVAFLLCRPW